MEDIPDGVVALLTRSSTDVLSHVAIRARTQGVLLAGCADEEEWKHLVDMQVGGLGLGGGGGRRCYWKASTEMVDDLTAMRAVVDA